MNKTQRENLVEFLQGRINATGKKIYLIYTSNDTPAQKLSQLQALVEVEKTFVEALRIVNECNIKELE